MRISDWSSDVCSSDLVHAQNTASRGVRGSRSGRRGMRAPKGWNSGPPVLATSQPPACRRRRWQARLGVHHWAWSTDRKRDVEEKSVSVRVELGGPGLIKKKEE